MTALDALDDLDGPEVRLELLGGDLAWLDEVDSRDPAQVYEGFWSDAVAGTPVLDRVRRWVQRDSW